MKSNLSKLHPLALGIFLSIAAPLGQADDVADIEKKRLEGIEEYQSFFNRDKAGEYSGPTQAELSAPGIDGEVAKERLKYVEDRSPFRKRKENSLNSSSSSPSKSSAQTSSATTPEVPASSGQEQEPQKNGWEYGYN